MKFGSYEALKKIWKLKAQELMRSQYNLNFNELCAVAMMFKFFVLKWKLYNYTYIIIPLNFHATPSTLADWFYFRSSKKRPTLFNTKLSITFSTILLVLELLSIYVLLSIPLARHETVLPKAINKAIILWNLFAKLRPSNNQNNGDTQGSI